MSNMRRKAETDYLKQHALPTPKLTIELVPQTCWFSNVRSNVKKSDWDRLRYMYYQKAGYKCEICGGKGSKWPVECHEIWEYEDDIHRQTLRGLIALCPACHEVKHIGLAQTRGRGFIAETHLARVNGWTPKRAKEYVYQAFETWMTRSLFEWTLDLSYLEAHNIKVIKKRERTCPP